MPKHPFDGGGKPSHHTPYRRTPGKSHYTENEREEMTPGRRNSWKRYAVYHPGPDEEGGGRFDMSDRESHRGNHYADRTYSQQAHPRNSTTRSEHDFYRHEGNETTPYDQGSEQSASVQSAGVEAMRALIQSHEENARLAAENEGLRQQLSTLRHQAQDVPAEIEDLRRQLSSFRQRMFDLRDEKEDMRQQLSASCRRVRDLENQLLDGRCMMPDSERGRGMRGVRGQPHNSFAPTRKMLSKQNSAIDLSAYRRSAKTVEEEAKEELRAGEEPL